MSGCPYLHFTVFPSIVMQAHGIRRVTLEFAGGQRYATWRMRVPHDVVFSWAKLLRVTRTRAVIASVDLTEIRARRLHGLRTGAVVSKIQSVFRRWEKLRWTSSFVVDLMVPIWLSFTIHIVVSHTTSFGWCSLCALKSSDLLQMGEKAN